MNRSNQTKPLAHPSPTWSGRFATGLAVLLLVGLTTAVQAVTTVYTTNTTLTTSAAVGANSDPGFQVRNGATLTINTGGSLTQADQATVFQIGLQLGTTDGLESGNLVMNAGMITNNEVGGNSICGIAAYGSSIATINEGLITVREEGNPDVPTNSVVFAAYGNSQFILKGGDFAASGTSLGKVTPFIASGNAMVDIYGGTWTLTEDSGAAGILGFNLSGSAQVVLHGTFTNAAGAAYPNGAITDTTGTIGGTLWNGDAFSLKFDRTAGGSITITSQGPVVGGNLVWQGDGSLNQWNITSPNWTNTAGGGLVNYTEGSTVTFNDTTTNTTVNLSGTVQPATILVTNSVNNYTFSGGTLGGAAQLTKRGNGTLTLSSVNTTNTGGTMIEGGTLVVSSASAQTLAGLTGAGALTKQGGGTLTIFGENTLNGQATVQGGTLAINNNASGKASYQINNGGTLSIAEATVGATLSVSNLTFGPGNPALSINDGLVSTLVPLISTPNFTNTGTVTVSYTATAIAPGAIVLIDYDAATSVVGSFNAPILPVGYSGIIVTNVAHSSIDLLITDVPDKQWVGGDSSSPGYSEIQWAVGSYLNWSGPTVFADGEYASFLDGTSYPIVAVGTVAPSLMVVSNSATAYAFTGSGITTPLLVKQGSGTASLANSGNSFTNILLQQGTLSYDANTTVTEAASISGSGTLVVGGAGTVLTLSGANSGFGGPISVTSGNTLKLGANDVLGTTNGATTIESGATLSVNGKINQAEKIIVSGAGVDSFSGAIVNTGGAQINALGWVKLVGDTTFGGTTRWDVRSLTGSTNNSVLDVPVACTLTKVGVGIVGLVNTTVGAGLGDINVQGGTFQVEGTTSSTVGNPNNTINLSFGTTLGLNAAAAVPIPGWNKKIALGGDATISKAGNGLAPLVGTVDLGSSTLTLNCTSGSLTFSNVISGGGNILKIGASPVSLLGANTYSGTTTVTNGSLTLSTASSGSSGYTVYANATLGARRHTAGGSLNMTALTLGDTGAGAVTLVFDLATYGGHPTIPVMNVSSGTLTTNAATYNVTVLADLNGLTTGTFPLLKYPAGTFTDAIVGLPLPAGVVGIITNNTAASQVELVVNSVARTLDWVGNVSSAWNINSTANWVETGTSNATVYKELGMGDNVRFTDTASNYTVSVAATVSPATMLVNATNGNYTIGGAFSIAGAAQLQVAVGATNTVTLTGNNTYTGGTYFDNGTTIVSSDANLGGYTVGGTNGVMRWAGGAVRFTASATNTRPLIVENTSQNCVIIVDTNKTVQLGGTLSMTGVEELRKSGPGSLVLTNSGSMRLWVEEGMTTVAGNAAVTNLGNGGQSISSTNGIARLVFKNSASLLVTDSTFSIGDGAGQTNSIIAGELTVQDNAVLALYSFDLGKFLNATGRVYQTGGTVTTNSGAQSYWRIGGSAAADTNAFGGYYLSVGTLNIPGRSPEIGRFGTGELIVSGNSTMQAATLSLGQSYPASGLLVVNGGAASVSLSGNLSVPVLGKTGTAVITNGGTLTAAALVLGNAGTNVTSGSVTVGAGGTLKVGRVSGSATNRSVTFNGGTLKASASSTTYMEGLTSATIASGGLTVDTDTNTITIGQNMAGGGGLTKTGAGTLVLKSQGYTGNTVVNAGTLKSQGLTTTTLAGNLIVNVGGTVAPGESIGKLLANGNVTLGGTNNLEIARQSLFVSDSDAVQAGGSIALGGTLNVTFDASHVTALSVGYSFTLFQAVGGLSGNFATVNLPTVDPVNGTNITWINTLSTDGKITVATVGTPGTTPSPTNITYTVSSGQMILNWPNGQGWVLQGQTNPLSVGLKTNWMNVSTNSPYTNLFVAPTAFYRLIYTNAP